MGREGAGGWVSGEGGSGWLGEWGVREGAGGWVSGEGGRERVVG